MLVTHTPFILQFLQVNLNFKVLLQHFFEVFCLVRVDLNTDCVRILATNFKVLLEDYATVQIVRYLCPVEALPINQSISKVELALTYFKKVFAHSEVYYLNSTISLKLTEEHKHKLICAIQFEYLLYSTVRFLIFNQTNIGYYIHKF